MQQSAANLKFKIAGGNRSASNRHMARGSATSQRLSYADFFGYFLVRRQESNTAFTKLNDHLPQHRYRAEITGNDLILGMSEKPAGATPLNDRLSALY